jgi:hypothetical protein
LITPALGTGIGRSDGRCIAQPFVGGLGSTEANGFGRCGLRPVGVSDVGLSFYAAPAGLTRSLRLRSNNFSKSNTLLANPFANVQALTSRILLEVVRLSEYGR